MAGPAVSLNGSPTVSPITAAAWASEPLPPCAPSSTSFFALSQAPPEFASMTAMSTPHGDRAREVRGERADAEAETDRDRRGDGQEARGDQLALGVAGADVDHAAVLGPLRALHDPGEARELVADLVHDGRRRSARRR